MFLKSLVVTGTLTAAAATAGSLATTGAVKSRWYQTLRKPAIQPPPAAFPVVWSTLYADIALASASVLADGAKLATDAPTPAENPARGYLGALAVNLALNAAWSWCFFRMRNLPLSVGVAGGLALSSVGLARRAGRVKPALGWLLAPYAAWCAFATVLSARVAALNK
ncbi:TspO/MBR family protein [Cryobacterium tepidiphilum]|jgi:tryptophan-rich sensory protein|uniref:Tryptophan-rich sensory protein n=1 Tax=Cryobacterium tepidiphilum TaxID=2486026 RepID=A0A3M8LHH6_9MICO|nr:TspO/MBR family protein [Cryobacterium tepidiphilum]RNE64192.1 tryptophan-rich sensory protein [Cryobacterium tepidiphilum]